MKLKTLNDLNGKLILKRDKKTIWRSETELKEEAVKWIKEDKEVAKRLHVDDIGTWEISIRRWMERFNITESDLIETEGGRKDENNRNN